MKLSIITINLNNREGLLDTINSVLMQTCYEQIEYVIVDGGSNDGSLEILKDCDKSIRYISESDNGIYNAMNKGTEMATGDYLLFLNSGDVLYDCRVIEDIYPALDSDADLLVGRIIDNKTMVPSPWGYEITMLSLYKSFIPHQSTFIKKSKMIKFMYDESYKISSDWKFFIQSLILDNCTYSWTDRIVTLYDHYGVSNTNSDLGRHERLSILNEFFPPRIITDYATFVNGQGYTNTDYDNFFLEFRPFKCGRLMYSFCVVIMKVLSIFLKIARKARKYPIRLFSSGEKSAK